MCRRQQMNRGRLITWSLMRAHIVRDPGRPGDLLLQRQQIIDDTWPPQHPHSVDAGVMGTLTSGDHPRVLPGWREEKGSAVVRDDERDLRWLGFSATFLIDLGGLRLGPRMIWFAARVVAPPPGKSSYCGFARRLPILLVPQLLAGVCQSQKK